MSRLAIIFPTVAWYFLKRSVAKKASNAAALSHASNRRTWSFTAAAPSSLIAVRYLSISAGTMSYSTTRIWRGPDCAIACSLRIGNSHTATPSAIARLPIATDFNIGLSSLFRMFGPSSVLLLAHLGTAEERDELAPFHVWMAPAWQEIIWRAAQRSLAVMCPACWCSPGGLLALMGSANRVLIIRTGSMSR